MESCNLERPIMDFFRKYYLIRPYLESRYYLNDLRLIILYGHSQKYSRLYFWTQPSKYKIFFVLYRLLHQKRDKSKSKNFINGKFKKWFYFLTCISPDYVSHESSKEFWKNSHYWNMRADFLKGVKKHFGKIALKWDIFRHEKNEFLTDIML